MRRRERRFLSFHQDTVQVARQLLGKRLVRRFENSDTVLQGRIIEVEAYLGVQDRACHSYGGRRTLRTEPMFQGSSRDDVHLFCVWDALLFQYIYWGTGRSCIDTCFVSTRRNPCHVQVEKAKQPQEPLQW